MMSIGFIWLIAIVVLFGGGWAIKVYLDRTNHENKLDAHEFAIVSPVLAIVILPLIGVIGFYLSLNYNTTYHEFWGGWETSTQIQQIACSEDGPCQNHYSCDEHTVVDHEAYTDKDGYHPRETHEESESCPYTTYENTFVVNSTVGPQTLGANWLPDNPEANRWTESEEYTSDHEWRQHSVPYDAPRGTPSLWQDAKNRVDAGKPGPVTAAENYDNYILASELTILKKYQGVVPSFKKKGLLPALNHNLKNPYYLDRVYLVGVHVANPDAWQASVERFNAALGNELQGNLYVVLVRSDASLDPDEYIGALTAYWESNVFGKDALSKNGIIVVLGTKDGTTVDWARGSTGMPTGNYAMTAEIQQKLPGLALTPNNLFGNPQATVVAPGPDHPRAAVTHTQGALEQILWGQNKFTRVSMGNKKSGPGSGYLYLKGEIPLTGGELTLIFVVMALSIFAGWAFCIFHGVAAYRNSSVYRKMPLFR